MYALLWFVICLFTLAPAFAQGLGPTVPGHILQGAGTRLQQQPVLNFSTGATCTNDATNHRITCTFAGTGGSVTSIATTSPITGGTITGTGTIACSTCLTTSTASIATTPFKYNGASQEVRVTGTATGQTVQFTGYDNDTTSKFALQYLGGSDLTQLVDSSGAGLQVGTSGFTPMLFNTGGTTRAWIKNTGLFEFLGTTTPTVTAGAGDCGTSPAIAGNSQTGVVTVGSSTNGNVCTLTAMVAYSAIPHCFCSNRTSNVRGCRVKGLSTTSISLNAAVTFTAGDVLDYGCLGHL